MKRFSFVTAGLAAAMILTVAVLAHDEHHPEPGHDPKPDRPLSKEVTIEGELVDAACFVHSGGDARGAGHAQCATECLASGIPAGVLPEGAHATHMKVILTNPLPLAEHAAKTVRVEGMVYHGFENVVEPKRIFVRDGDDWTEIQLDDAHQEDAGHGHGEEAGHGHGDEAGHQRH